MGGDIPDVPLQAPSLLNLSAGFLAKRHLDCLNASKPSGSKDFLENVYLPTLASQALLEQQRRYFDGKNDAEMLSSLCNNKRFPLTSVDLTGATLNDDYLVDILEAHKDAVASLDLTDMKGVSENCNHLLEMRDVRFPRLKSLRMNSVDILRKPPKRKSGHISKANIPVLNEDDLVRCSTTNSSQPNSSYVDIHIVYQECFKNADRCHNSFGHGPNSSGSRMSIDEIEIEEREPALFTSRCPEVSSLYLPAKNDEEIRTSEFLESVLGPLKNLRALDISYWTRVDSLRFLNALNLTTLVLYDVPDLYKAVDNIVLLSELRYLDVSQSNRDNTGIYPKPVTTLHKFVTSLTNLEKLDISSTNLAAQPSDDDWPVTPEMIQCGNVESDIVGLRFLRKPLQYIGLFNCENASHFAQIPALEISGDANEDQIIKALEMYQERAGLLQSVLNESYQLYRFGNSLPLARQAEALHLVLSAMQRHLDDSTLQIAGSASLFYIIRKVQMNRDTKRSVVTALLSGMEKHIEEQVMVRNCCLSLCQFEIPAEILFDYSRLAKILVRVLQHHNADQLTQRIVVFLLNSMACHVEGDQKLQIGSFGAIEVILEQIKRKLAARTSDDVMEVGWSFLWNITDETPANCERFLNSDGLNLFKKCYDEFNSERELVRNMMGLIGNIAEVDRLRQQLMEDDYVSIFVQLLGSVEDSIEISYNSAGVLAHMVSDGEVAWQKMSIQREGVMKNIVQATTKWKLDTRRFINYRSFRPILRLLPLWHAYASQHWAVWALANLTTTDGPKYCGYVTEEGGLPLLEELVANAKTLDETRHLASIVLKNIQHEKMKELELLQKESEKQDSPVPMEIDN